MIQITSAQYKSFIAANSKEKAKISKYRAKPTTVDGIRFHSKKEAEYYKVLKDREEKGEIWYFLMQVPFRLPGGIRHLVDFMIIHHPSMKRDSINEFIECKGHDNALGRLKRKQVEEIYGIEIKVV